MIDETPTTLAKADTEITLLIWIWGDSGPVRPDPGVGGERESVGFELGSLADLANRSQRSERAAHQLRGPHTTRIVCGLRLEQFRLRQKDSELVIQAMKQRLKVRGPSACRRRRRSSGATSHVRSGRGPGV